MHLLTHLRYLHSKHSDSRGGQLVIEELADRLELDLQTPPSRFMQPTGERIFVRRDPAPTHYPALAGQQPLEIPMAERRKLQNPTGTVLAIGPLVGDRVQVLEDLPDGPGQRSLRVGDRVLFNDFAGNELPDPMKKDLPVYVFSPDEIIAVLGEDEPA